jgi:tight adherence protein B
MTVVLGLLLGAGLVLIASTWLWPRTAAVSRRPAGDGMRARLVQAGLGEVPVTVFVVVSVVLALGAAAVAAVLLPVPALAIAAGGVAGFVPALVISGRARRRRRALRAAWPDLVDHLVSGVRSGHSLMDAVAGLAEVGPSDLRAAFTSFGQVAAATGNLGAALDDLKDRMADPVADRIVETLRISRDVGGTELPTLLRSLSAYLRQEGALRSEVEARQSWVLNAARLGVAAPWIVLLLLASRPETAAAYNSPAGLTLLGVGLAVTVIAYRVMVSLGRLPEERRWFA